MPTPRRPIARYLLLLLLAAAVVAYVTAHFTTVELTIGDVVVRTERATAEPFPAPPEGVDWVADRRPLPQRSAPSEAPRNAVILLGDGMGIGHLSTVSALGFGPGGGLAVEAAEITGLVRTNAADDLVTDSAAAATALATGFKTDTAMVSVLRDGRVPTTLFEAAKAHGLRTGFITTAGVADATPAAFLTHARSRSDYAEILSQILGSSADVVIGGDWQRHPKASSNPDYRNLVRRAETAACAQLTVVRDIEQLDPATLPVLALLPPRPGHRRIHGPPLAVSARRALELLADGDSRFLLVIESEQTDDGGHANDVRQVVDGLKELDDAVRVVLEFASSHADTLILVTGDHETAGLAVVEGGYDHAISRIRWVTDGHAANWVPLFAFGPGATRLSGVFDNTVVGPTVAELLGIPDFPAIRSAHGAD